MLQMLKQAQQKGGICKFHIKQFENQPSMFFCVFLISLLLATWRHNQILEYWNTTSSKSLLSFLQQSYQLLVSQAEMVNINVVLCLIASAVDIVRNSKKTIQAKIK